jgi:hypothetical protein
VEEQVVQEVADEQTAQLLEHVIQVLVAVLTKVALGQLLAQLSPVAVAICTYPLAQTVQELPAQTEQPAVEQTVQTEFRE